jgi:hypothetical protein
MFVIDGNWLNSKYKVKPMDYWDRMWNHEGSQRTRESEDRVFSRAPHIPIDGVTAVHVLLRTPMENRSSEVRNIMILSKTRGIPTFLYSDDNAWRLQDTRRAISPSTASDLLRGPTGKGYSSRGRNFLEPWLELIYKNKKEDLSTYGEKLRYHLVYHGRNYRDDDCGLSNDMSNARKPDSDADYRIANKITDYMLRNKLPNTLALKNAIVDKWDNIS